MRQLDLLRIAAGQPGEKRAIVPILGMAICVFCLCFAGAILLSVQMEKAAPVEMTVIPKGSRMLMRDDLNKISAVKGVMAATPTLELAIGIRAGKSSAQLTLIGLDAAYVDGGFSQGGAFPNESGMPYLVLNEAACALFAGEEDEESPGIDRLNENLSLLAGEGGSPISAKVCGIVEGGTEGGEPAGYVSLSEAKELLRMGGQSTKLSMAKVRATNSHAAARVQSEIEALGFLIEKADAGNEEKWAAQSKEMGYLLAIAALGLLGSAFLFCAQCRVEQCLHKAEIELLAFLGMKKEEIGRLHLYQSLWTALYGAFAGGIVCALLPGFLMQEGAMGSCFGQPVPLWIIPVAAALGICVFAGLCGVQTRRCDA